MKKVKNLKTVMFMSISIFLVISLATFLPAMSSYTVCIIVKTSKPSYQAGEHIYVHGNLTVPGCLSNRLVGLALQDPNHDTVFIIALQTDAEGMFSLRFKLPGISKLGTYTVYVSSSYGDEVVTNKTTFGLVQIIEITVMKDGTRYPATIESNSTVTNITADINILCFNNTGSFGGAAYVKVTIPRGLKTTKIKVFIDSIQLIPPQFPIITSNSTHYFIYFEFTLSTREITIQYAIADIAITNVTPCKTVVGEGYTLNINTTIQNQGHNEETFNVTVFYDETAITLPNGKNHTTIILQNGTSTTIIFTWNTTGVAKGNYSISAYAAPVSGETDTTDNTVTDGWVIVAMVGDIMGETANPWEFVPDGKVDGKDSSVVCRCFGSWPRAPPPLRYHPNCDANNDGQIDGRDITVVTRHFGEDAP